MSGLEDRYEISDLGRVRSLYRDSLRILSPSISNSGGYPLYMLTKNGVRYPRYGHHLVAEAFIGERPEGQGIRHLDGNASSAALRDVDGIQRLVYGTPSENAYDRVRHGTHSEANRDRCDKGHAYTEANTYIATWPDGSFKQRVCRTCHNEASKERRDAQAANALPCTEDGCEEPQWAKKLCGRHYRMQRPECTEEGCDKPRTGKKLCATHYARLRTAARKAQEAA